MDDDGELFGMQISHVRAILGFVCREVALTGRPLGIRRYRAMDVVIVPLAEWRRLKSIEAEMAAAEETPRPGGPRHGRTVSYLDGPVNQAEFRRFLAADSGPTCLAVRADLREGSVGPSGPRGTRT